MALEEYRVVIWLYTSSQVIETWGIISIWLRAGRIKSQLMNTELKIVSSKLTLVGRLKAHLD